MRFFRIFVVSAILLTMPPAAGAAIREYFGVDPIPLDGQMTVVVDAWDLNVFVRGADTQVLQCSTDLKIAGIGAEKADQWILTRTPKFTTTDTGVEIAIEAGDEGFLGLASLTRRRRLGIIVPLTAIPDLTTSSGNIEIEGDFGAADPLRLRTGSGTMTFRGGATALEIRTTSGDTTVEVHRPLELISALTSSGSLSLAGGARRVEVETASGDIELSGLSGAATAESVSGHITVQWDRLDPGVSVKLRTFKGDITITLPSDINPSGTLTTATGEIHSDFEGDISESGDSVTLTGDGPTLDIETASGKLTLIKDPGWFAPQE